MTPKIANISLRIDGMTCVSCENRIENTLRRTTGIESVRVSYTDARVSVTYDANVIDQAAIESIIEALDYQVRRPNPAGGQNRSRQPAAAARQVNKPGSGPAGQTVKPAGNVQLVTRILGVGIILAALFLIIGQFGGLTLFSAFPQAEQGMGYGLLFVIGLLTSLHCVAMCGGINLSQCVPQAATLAARPRAGSAVSINPLAASGSDGQNPARGASLRPAFLYNAGRVISYTVIGGIVGALGSVVSFSGWAKGLVALAAGVFMVIMGLNMLNLFPGLRRFSPRLPKVFARKINQAKQNSSRGPLYIGLLNGLMPCGPLQAMQLYALSTGSPLRGALSMLLFSLGTVPLMFGLGAVSSLLSRKFTRRMVQVSAALVIILGIFMFQNGMSLSGLAMPSLADRSVKTGQTVQSTVLSGSNPESNVQNGVQIVTTQLSANKYEPITVQAGIPVRWTIQAAAGTVTGCNNRLIIPEYNIEKDLAVGDNVIEFTPVKSGTVPFSCWMGMIRSKITIVEPDAASAAEAKKAVDVTEATLAAAASPDSDDSLTKETTAGNLLSDEAGGGSDSLPAGCCGLAGSAQPTTGETSAGDTAPAQAPAGGSCCG